VPFEQLDLKQPAISNRDFKEYFKAQGIYLFECDECIKNQKRGIYVLNEPECLLCGHSNLYYDSGLVVDQAQWTLCESAIEESMRNLWG
jgi:hypothetical protein